LMLNRRDITQWDFSWQGWLYMRGDFFQIADKRIGIVRHELPESIQNALPLDFLILSGNPDVRVGQLLDLFKVREIIADPTNKAWKVRKWKEEAKKYNIGFYSVSETGAYYREF
jgi:hypothetical protein